MTQTKTKKALLMSVLSMVLCVAMLVGMTFAWFTDTASTGVNKIQAGNLKMEVSYKNTPKGEFAILDEKTNVFKQDTLWEPGHVEYAVLKVKNVGTLALKYKLGINIASETGSINVDGKPFELSDYIKFAVVDDDQSGLGRAALVAEAEKADSKLIKAGYTKESNLLAKTASDAENPSKTVTLVVWMPESVGNEANHAVDAAAPVINLGINVAATQLNSENDSFGPDYDKNATYPDVVYSQPTTTEEMNTALTQATSDDGKPAKIVEIALPTNTSVTLDNGIVNSNGNDGKGRNVTFKGDGTQTVDVITKAVNAEGGQLNYQRGSSFTFEKMNIEAGEGNFDGIVCDELVFKDCKISGKLTLYGKATFIDCKFENTMENQYSIWTWGGTDVKFENCIFNTNGKAILLYGQATAEKPTNLTVNKCTFNDRENGTAGKAAIEIGNDYKATYTLTVNEATVNGFADGENTGSKLWANKNSMDAEHLTVIIDNNKIQL